MKLSEWERDHLSPKEGWSDLRVRPIDLQGAKVSNPWWLDAGEQLIYPCINGVSTSRLHGARPLGRCRKWTCRHCGEANKKRLLGEIGFCRSVHRGLAVFSVLTFWHKNGIVKNPRTGRVLSPDTQMAYIRKWYTKASKILRTNARCSIPEPHKDGSLHMNVIWFGVPRSFWSCNITNKMGQRDMRLQCGECFACGLRTEWTTISGASRSTHEVTSGDTARYVGKYLTKDWMQNWYSETGKKRYSFSQSVKRLHSMVPVYRYIGQTLRDVGEWHWGAKKHGSDIRGTDYLSYEDVFLQDRSEYNRVSIDVPDGKWLPRESCSEKHHGLCDQVPYWSPTKQRAWDYKHWDWFADAYGEDTRQMIQDKIYNAWEFISPRLESTEWL